MISDNGKAFKVASKLLLDIVKHPEVEYCLSETHIQNLERAPWWGGIFERMVKSVKCCLHKTIGSLSNLHLLTQCVRYRTSIIKSRSSFSIDMELSLCSLLFLTYY